MLCQRVKGKRSGFSKRRERLTLLSELGIMVSVIQEPNLDPDARTVMGLLTPVSFPQPGGQRDGKRTYTHIYCIYLMYMCIPQRTYKYAPCIL